jgi:hypothetical protein
MIKRSSRVDEAGLNETMGIDDVSSVYDYRMMMPRLLLDLCSVQSIARAKATGLYFLQ